jgi:phosphate transport system substrate-binding protein
MKATCWYVTWGVALSLWVATSAMSAEDPNASSDRDFIRIRGSLPLADSVERLGKRFAEEHPGNATVVTGGGMKAAFEALSENLADMVMASRRARPSEIRVAVRKGIHLEERLIDAAATAVFVSSALPVHQLTLDQLRKIYKGEIDRWSQVGGPDTLIEPYSLPDEPRGSAGWFRSKVMDSAEFASRTEFVKDPVQVVKRVASTSTGIGYLDSIVLDEALASDKDVQINVIKLAADPHTPALLPSPERIRDGVYPLTRGWLFYWNAGTANKNISAFVDFCSARAANRH